MSAKSASLLLLVASSAQALIIDLPITPVPGLASEVVPRDFLSYSIETTDYPDFGGSDAEPNPFTKQLVGNLAEETGVLPIIRIGGATSERLHYVADQKEQMIPYWDYDYNKDQPRNATIGPSYWQSLTQMQDTARFIFDLNFAKNDSGYIDNLRSCVAETRRQVDKDKIHMFEIGNEDDTLRSQRFRPANYTVDEFSREWINRSRSINEVNNNEIRFMAPSLSGLNAEFSPYRMLSPTDLDMDRDGWISEISHHMYIMGAHQKPELQKHLLNHTVLVKQAYWPVDYGRRMREEGRYYTLGECNSIYGQGAPSVSDVFGAALWNVDFALYIASTSIRRVHMHQGTSYRYASWLPIQVNETAPHVRPPYYANVFVSRFIGPSGTTRIENIPVSPELSDVNVAYAAYENDKLARVALLNMREYNITSPAKCRPRTTFTFPAPAGTTKALVTRLRAPHAHEFTDITIDGVSYSYESGGKGVKIRHDSQVTEAKNGKFTVRVENSGAAMVTLL